MAVDIIAIITPKAETVDVVGQVRCISFCICVPILSSQSQLLNDLAKAVKENEPNTLRYHPYRTVRADGTVEYVLLER